MRIHILLFISAATFFISSCGSEKEIDKIGNAQICLNSATDATSANACLSKIDGIESKGAYAVRCNGSFIAEGFANPAKYINAANSLNGSGGGGTTSFMRLIMFTSSGSSLSANLNYAFSTFSNCLNSGAKGTTLISSFSYLITSIYNYGGSPAGSCAYPPSDNNAIATCLAADPAALVEMVNPNTVNSNAISLQSSLGSVIVSTYNISCTGTGANQSLCSTISTAINNAGGANNTRAVAVQFFKTTICSVATCPP